MKEIIKYMIFGIATTLVNMISFATLDFLSVDFRINTLIAWVLSVLFAFYTNRKYVFNINSSNCLLKKEMFKFFGARLVSLLIDIILMIVFVNIMFINSIIAKLISNIFIVILNYILSKFFIFKQK